MAKLRLNNEWKLWLILGVIGLAIAGYLYLVSRPPMEDGEYLWHVTKVSGPDELTLKGSGTTMRIKLIGLRIPASQQESAQRFLDKTLKGEWVRTKTLREQADGVKVGFVYLSRDDINARMIRLGLAKIDRSEKAFDVRPYIELEQEAKKRRRGLWEKSG